MTSPANAPTNPRVLGVAEERVGAVGLPCKPNHHEGATMPGTYAEVHEYPKCDICRSQGVAKEARYDGKTWGGPWAFMCRTHFYEHGMGLGVGRGQQLTLIAKEQG